MRRLPFRWMTAGASVIIFFLPSIASAHCPLCTAGAGLAAIIAIKFGISAMSVGVFIGAFAVAIGLWIARGVKKQFVPRQATVLAIISFLLTVLPLRAILSQYRSVYISMSGDYGSWLNRTYLIDIFLAGSILGAILLAVAPALSRWVSARRGGKRWPYQGMSIIAVLLILTAILIELLIWIPPFSS